MEPWSHLPGKVVLVTGASSGLGREFCLDLAKAGCHIIAAARRTEKLKSLCDEITSINNDLEKMSITIKPPMSVELDVTSDENVIFEAVQTAWNAFGHIDVLINNAGVRGSISLVTDLSEKEWKNTIKTNLTGAWVVARNVAKLMAKDGICGCIINISSISGLNRVYTPGGAAYCASKAALQNLTKVMALEMGKHSIRVNAIAPGIFLSEITEELFKKKWAVDVTKRALPLRTIGETDPALTSLIRYLIHDSSCYVSGNIFIVDSGYTLPGFPLSSSL
ncbi:3-oxoacyl-[acyl-carrier-protein] reductase FabG-like [Impatiens glandulifera]|uniref:3-oxoacyl-[acyl-carrier-protein] reductase FabG-like n=1 Tax=Impatiens glandulifera TaxID=253017 RepID=UPI001FB09EF4|nr:3-oxoacyl-[acyl-carrier-protein] reductase FabG-like [Impatiens glandulifera]